MNYLAEIVAFSEWKEVNPLPASAIALWYELMSICNKTGWRQEFTVANGLLQAKCSLSRKEFDHARSVLINFGRIRYKKSDRVNQAGKYSLISIVQKGQREVQQQGQQEGQREAHTEGNAGGTLFKPKLELKLKPKNIDDNAREAEPVDKSQEPDFTLLRKLEREHGPLSSVEISCLTEWRESFAVDVLTECFRRYKANGGMGRKYMDTVFINWHKAGVKTLDDIQCQDQIFEQQKNKQYTARGNPDNVTDLMAKALGGI